MKPQALTWRTGPPPAEAIAAFVALFGVTDCKPGESGMPAPSPGKAAIAPRRQQVRPERSGIETFPAFVPPPIITSYLRARDPAVMECAAELRKVARRWEAVAARHRGGPASIAVGLLHTDPPRDNDYTQCAVETALRIWPRFDPKRGSTFLAFALPFIHADLRNHVARERSIVRKCEGDRDGDAELDAPIQDTGDDQVDDDAPGSLMELATAQPGEEAMIGTAGLRNYTEEAAIDRLDRKRQREVARKAIARLPARDRGVLACDVRGETGAEIGRRLGLTPDGGRRAVLRAVGRAREMVQAVTVRYNSPGDAVSEMVPGYGTYCVGAQECGLHCHV